MLETRQFATGKMFLTRLAATAIVAALAAPLTAIGEEPALVRAADSAELEWGPCPEFMPEGCAVAVLHGDPAEPNADVFFKLAGNSTVPAHRHTSAERMVLVSGQMQVQYEGQEAEVLNAGNYAYGPAGLSHRASCDSDEDCVLFIAFEEPVDAMPTEE
jgi:quercetin dioxygenase-like cupin family protein